jgi:protein SCO1/2
MSRFYHARRSAVACIASAVLAFAATACGDHLKAHGQIIDEATAPLRLSNGGKPFDIGAERGKVVALFFGYTHCGDVCPTTLAHVAQALALPGKGSRPIETVFISVDPRRDTPAVVAEYARRFNSGFIGVTGTPQELETVQHDYHVWSKAMPADKAGNYEVSHSSELFLLAPDGRVRVLEDWDVSARDLADDLHALQ